MAHWFSELWALKGCCEERSRDKESERQSSIIPAMLLCISMYCHTHVPCQIYRTALHIRWPYNLGPESAGSWWSMSPRFCPLYKTFSLVTGSLKIQLVIEEKGKWLPVKLVAALQSVYRTLVWYITCAKLHWGAVHSEWPVNMAEYVNTCEIAYFVGSACEIAYFRAVACLFIKFCTP